MSIVTPLGHDVILDHDNFFLKESSRRASEAVSCLTFVSSGMANADWM